jgi:hypothetical protein
MIGEGLVDIERDVHTSFKYHETNDYGRNLDMLMISHYLHVSHCIEKWVQRENYSNNTRLSYSSQRLGWPTIGPSKATYLRQR